MVPKFIYRHLWILLFIIYCIKSQSYRKTFFLFDSVIVYVLLKEQKGSNNFMLLFLLQCSTNYMICDLWNIKINVLISELFTIIELFRITSDIIYYFITSHFSKWNVVWIFLNKFKCYIHKNRRQSKNYYYYYFMVLFEHSCLVCFDIILIQIVIFSKQSIIL